MIKSVSRSAIIASFLQLIACGHSLGDEFQELKRPYFCSTCFTTTQDQNYHCCFYFFKCCAEARLGSRSTTPNPGYPAGLPSGVTFFVTNRNNQPCSVDCRDPREASNLCCRMQSSRPTRNKSVAESGDDEFKPAYNIQDSDEVGDAELNKSSPGESSKSTETTDENTSKTKYQSLGLDITGSPFRLNLKNINSEGKLFHAPSIIFDHESEGDSAGSGENWRKRGWFTKDILNQDINKQEARLPPVLTGK